MQTQAHQRRGERGPIIWVIVASALLLLLLTACSGPEMSMPAAPSTASVFMVEPIFEDLYNALGGGGVIGEPISGMKNFDGLQCQYTLNVMMCLDPSKTGVDQYILAPLGTKLGIVSEQDAPFGADGRKVVEGYIIYEKFVPLYDSLFGTRFTGMPLTSARYNPETNQIEQVFENLIMAIEMEDGASTPRLLSLGYHDCGQPCSYAVSKAPESEIPRAGAPFSSFPDMIEQCGMDTFGAPLTKEFAFGDGYTMQIFENMAAYRSTDSSTGQARSNLFLISRELGKTVMQPREKTLDVENGYTFKTTDGVLGFHVPLVFDDFITSHGGYTCSGNPIAEILQAAETVYQQCYEHYCLEYDTAKPEEDRISITRQGEVYLNQLLSSSRIEPSALLNSTLVPEDVLIWVTEENPQVYPDMQQTIFVAVLRGDYTTPVAGQVTVLTLTYPDGKVEAYEIIPTDGRGFASIIIQPTAFETPGMVVYKVCAQTYGGAQVCASDQYLQWEPPPVP